MLAIIIAALFGPVVSMNFTGSDDCPCIVVNHTSEAVVDDATYAYPADYGSTYCKPHDDGLEPYCDSDYIDDDQAAYCVQSWCYVDPDKCQDSSYSYLRGTAYSDLYYSLDTCGNGSTSAFDNIPNKVILNGTVIRAAIPALVHPDHYQVDSDGNIITGATTNNTAGYQGLYIDIFEEISARSGFTVEWDYTSLGSRKSHTSSWSACVDDVSKGLLDICVGNFWTTSDRLAMTAFTNTLDIDTFHMLAPRDLHEASLAETLIQPFMPFTPGAWICIILVILLTSIVKAKVVVAKDKIDLVSLRGEKCHKYGAAGVVRYEMYECILEFLSCGVDYCDDKRVAPRLLSIGYGLFVLIAIACYTGNLTAMLTTANLHTSGFQSFQDCIDNKCSICVNSGIAWGFEIVYGSTGAEIIIAPGSGGYDDILNAMTAKTCDVALMDDTTYKINSMRGQDDICDFHYVGPVLLWIPVSQPVSSAMAQPISYWYRDMVASGRFQEIFDEYIPYHASGCDPNVATDVDEDNMALDYHAFLGPTLFCVIVGFVAIMIDLRVNGWSTFKHICSMQFLPHRGRFVPEDVKEAKAEAVDTDEVDVPEYLLKFHSQYEKDHADIMRRLDNLTGGLTPDYYDREDEMSPIFCNE